MLANLTATAIGLRSPRGFPVEPLPICKRTWCDCSDRLAQEVQK